LAREAVRAAIYWLVISDKVAACLVSPRANHLQQALRAIAYLKTNPKYKLVFDPYQQEMDCR
jgi:hypothetical protein